MRASSFASVLPSVVSKYGLGRKIGVERWRNAWNEALEVVFGDRGDFGDFDDERDVDASAPSRLETFRKYARPASYRSRTLRVEVTSNLLMQELQFYSARLLNELRRILPDESIEKIKLVAK